MHAIANTLKNSLISKSFAIGIILTIVFYVGLLAWALFSSSASLSSLDDRLASETVIIDRGLDLAEESATESIESQSLNFENDVPIETKPEPVKPIKENVNPLPFEAIAGLYETDTTGNLIPIIRTSDGMTPFEAYSSPFIAKPNTSLITLIIDDFGLKGQQSEILSIVPSNTTILMSPYSDGIKNISRYVLQNGHELWLKAPFETQNFPNDDPGPKAILRLSSLNQNQENLKWIMKRTEVYTGIAGYTDISFSNENPMINALARTIMNRGLGFLEMNVSAQPQIRDLAQRQNAPYGKVDVRLNDTKWKNRINEALDLLESIAQSRGSAVAILSPFPETIDSIQQWSTTLANKNIEIVPLSAVIKDRNPTLHTSMNK